jgi:hypothetical protein
MAETDQVQSNAGKAGGSPARTSGLWHPPTARPALAIRHSFVVRIWQEESVDAWRGWVEHTRSGEAAFVQELEQLLSFIQERTGRLG